MVLQIANDAGLMKPVQRAWVHDGAQFKVATCAWVADPAGVMKKEVDCISSVGITASPLNHLTARVSWSAPGANQVEVLKAGAVVFTSTSPASYYDVTGLVPNSLVIFSIRATSINNTVESTPVTVTMPPMPPPGTLHAGQITSTSFVLDWSTIAGASSYRVYNTSNQSVFLSTTNNYMGFSGLTPGSTQSKVVKSVHATGGVSAASSPITFNMQNAFPAGTYSFIATSGNTWEGTGQRWRGTSEGKMWHGDGGYFGAAGGTRFAFFFGYTNGSHSIPQWFASQGVVPINLTKFEVYMTRLSAAHGVYSAQPCRWYMHQHGSQPTHPSVSTGAIDSGSLALGDGAWFSLDLGWGRALMDGSHLGMVWGGMQALPGGAGYMQCPTLAINGSVGAVRFTVA